MSTALVAGCCGSAEQHHLIGAYDLFEQLVELLLERITAVMVDLESRDGILTMKLQIGCDSSIDPEQLRCIRLPGGQLMLEVQEEDLILRVTLGREGGVE